MILNTGAILNGRKEQMNKKQQWTDRTGNLNRKGMILHGSDNAAALVDLVGVGD